MTIILSREGAEPRVFGSFFKAAAQEVYLFGSDTWVVTPCMVMVLEGFQDQVPQPLTRRLSRRKTDRKWEYTSAATAREEAGFQTIEDDI